MVRAYSFRFSARIYSTATPMVRSRFFSRFADSLVVYPVYFFLQCIVGSRLTNIKHLECPKLAVIVKH